MVDIELCLVEWERNGNMKLKPRTTMLNTRGAVYKRYTQIERSVSDNIYYTIQDKKYWVFSLDKLTFIEIGSNFDYSGKIIISVPNDNGNTRFQYLNKSYRYTHATGWVSETISFDLAEKVKVATIGTYQINKYYYFGSFDYTIKGSITGSKTQYIKGHITPTISMNIKHYNDYIDLQPDDLVVIDNRLFAVESVEEDHKHQPKDFTIHYAILNNIL